ncbi:homoserine dehydrogenase [Skeletonema marinoi]|uniref:homoserine dehydrogenase n=1 Tax=Skeletonema marinoi TaxID=267567 RepID=A0AAD9DIW0_9STRA|nr:homoserine dehydrogenase [Skeletonema marinoi]
MKEISLVLLGFGSANRTLAQMLLDKSEKDNSCRQCLRVVAPGGTSTSELVPWKVVCIITRRHGRVCVPHSSKSEINVEEALERIGAGGILDATLVRNTNEATTSTAHSTTTDDTIKLLNELGKTQTANIVVEAIPSNPKSDGEPAISFIRTALQAGMHVASANKCPLTHTRNDKETYFELQGIAKRNGKIYLHESAVMDGVPIFSFWDNLPGVTCTKIRGLLNSTSTMILSRIEGNIDKVVESDGKVEHVGETFEEALEAAKKVGIVEEDESLDIDGWDAAMKLRALCVFLSSSGNLSLPEDHDVIVPPLEAIPRDSISQIDPELICTEFRASRKKVRSVASAELVDLPSDPAIGRHHPVKSWKMSVENEFLSQSDPLYNLNGSSASVQFSTDVMGPISVVSQDPTLMDTAYGLFADVVRIASQSINNT